MKIKVFIDHSLSDNGVLLSDLIRVQILKYNLVVKDFMFDEVDSQSLSDSQFYLVDEAVEDYSYKYITGRISRMLDPIEDKVQVYELEKRTYLRAV